MPKLEQTAVVRSTHEKTYKEVAKNTRSCHKVHPWVKGPSHKERLKKMLLITQGDRTERADLITTYIY